MIETIHFGNVLFTGDAANQNFKPYVEGILPSIICGDIAGKTAINNENKYEEKVVNFIKESIKVEEKEIS